MHTKSLTLVASLGLSLACARTPLEAEVPKEVAGKTGVREGPGDTLIADVAGVIVKANVDAWEGDQNVFEHVTPVRVEITNDSVAKLRVRYQDFKLEAANGEVYHALPLYRITGTMTEPVLTSEWEYTPVYQEGFYVAPYTASAYVGEYTVFDGNFEYEPAYYDAYYGYWAAVPLPTPYMIRASLTEGVLGQHGHMLGWLYFERVPDRKELEPVTLSMSLVNADTGASLGEVRIPFSVD